MPGHRWRSELVASTVAVLVFAAHAASYLYFFVDDEAIPLVYARNLLRGMGLAYSPNEGHVEGYSDFFHVLWNTAVLSVTSALHLSPLTPLWIGRAVSFALGIGLVVLVGRFLSRLHATGEGRITGLAIVALAGPLALWSCSSLEAVPFAFLITSFTYLTLAEQPVRPWIPILMAVLAILERLDGFVYVFAVLIGALVAATPGRRRWMILRVVTPIVTVAIVYHTARFAYFGTLLSAPLAAKVLYKLEPGRHVISKAPDEPYLTSFLKLYGPPIALAIPLAAWLARRSRAAVGVIVIAGLMSIYVGVVGDWMFGYRFCVTIIPLAAIVLGTAVSTLPRTAALTAVLLTIAWSGFGAVRFGRTYVQHEHRPIWWRAPREGKRVWLSPYYDLIKEARKAHVRGKTIAYNQAGLVPYMLDADNVDDLGICSSFVAGLPTTDVYFTEVGRYSPLTDAPVLAAAHAYLLYRDVDVLMARTDLLVTANGRVPPSLLDDYFHLSRLDESAQNAVYVRSEKDATRFHTDAGQFRENLAHYSHIRRADLNGRRLSDDELGPALGFLRWRTGKLHISGTAELIVRFANADETVHELYAGALSTEGGRATVVLRLHTAAGRLVAEHALEVTKRSLPMFWRLDAPVEAAVLSLEARADGRPALLITDLRVQGQSAALRDYVRGKLNLRDSAVR